MKVFVTKYALTIGIEEFDAGYAESYPSMVSRKTDHWHTFTYHGEGKDWHRTREAAVTRANQMRVAKIASLKKQIAKLESWAFK